MLVNAEDLCAHVASHAGVGVGEIERPIRSVLSGIGVFLSRAQRQLVAEELPPAIAPALFAAGEDRALPLEERVLTPGMSAGHARELVASVCHVLAEELSLEALRALRTSLPASIAELLEGDAPPPPLHGESLRPDSLASGRPGSRHPISEERPRDRTQPDSIVAGNPHADSKLSSSAGTTQERRHDTLAEGHAEPARKVSTTKS